MTKTEANTEIARLQAEIKELRTAKTQNPQMWAMGRFTASGIEILQVGDHNPIEAASKAVNTAAKMRVAFVVDIRAVPAELLAPLRDGAAQEAEDEESETADEGEPEPVEA